MKLLQERTPFNSELEYLEDHEQDMGTNCDVILECIPARYDTRDKKPEKIVQAVLNLTYDGYYEGIGCYLASFLADMKFLDKDEEETYRCTTDSGDLFARIITLLKGSCEKVGVCRLIDPSSDFTGYDGYVYRVLVDEEEKTITFHAQGQFEEIHVDTVENGHITESEIQREADDFVGTPQQFLDRYQTESSMIYDSHLSKKRKADETIEDRKEIIKKMRNILDESERSGAIIFENSRREIVQLLDAVCNM